MMRTKRNIQAVSLAEVLLAIFLVAVVSLAAYGLLIQVMRLDSVDENRTEFVQFAQQVVETYIEEAKYQSRTDETGFETGFDHLEEIPDDDPQPLEYGDVLGGTSGEQSDYLYSVSITPWQGKETLKMITVRVWYSRDGITVDTTQGNVGLATQLSVIVARPTR